jgi:hypothetical protein
MEKSLLNAKKIKLNVSTCDTNDTEKRESYTNEAVLMEDLPDDNDDGHSQNRWKKVNGVISLIYTSGLSLRTIPSTPYTSSCRSV